MDGLREGDRIVPRATEDDPQTGDTEEPAILEEERLDGVSSENPKTDGTIAVDAGRHAWRFVLSNLRFLVSGGYVLPSGHRLGSAHAVSADFFGICVASCPDPECDRYNIDQLQELGIRHVRLDYSSDAPAGHTGRFLEQLLQAGMQVCLHLVQPREAARQMQSEAAQQVWRRFVRATLERFGPRLALVELGSTCNRRKWSGYSFGTVVVAWRIAHEEAAAQGVQIAAPNVTDFEPIYNVGFLDIAREEGMLPAIHSDNLFAERATEPEAYDHKILGWTLAPLIKYNVVKKAALLRQITSRYGIEKLMCGHVAWSERRIRRQLADPSQKQADYLQRYLCLVAASGTFDRVYWGPMIGQREGIIDDGSVEYPDELPHVTFYGKAKGAVSEYQRRPAFYALKTVVQMLSGTQFVRDHSTSQALRLLEFNKGEFCLHVVWTTNGNGFDPASWYDPDALSRASVYRRDGDALETFPCIIGESPVFLAWEGAPPSFSTAAPLPMKRHRFHSAPHEVLRRVADEQWLGVVVTPSQGDPADLVNALHPTMLDLAADKSLLRDGRNTVWSFVLPTPTAETVVVKRSQVRSWFRRLLDLHKPSRSLRSWNGANELQRRGIATPRPLAFFEQAKRSGNRIGYFVCETFSSSGSVRSAFHEFARGKDAYEGVPKETFYREFAAFTRRMHGRGVFFRDFSSGNILMKVEHDGLPSFSLIDTTRARFFRRPVSLGYQLSDLKRVCHRLTWPERHAFLEHYFTEADAGRALRIRVTFGLYDAKHWYKQRVKRFRGR